MTAEFDSSAKTWTHIKVLYSLCIILSAVVLALFVVCFLMVIDIQKEINGEIQLRKSRENEFLKDIVIQPEARTSDSQRSEAHPNSIHSEAIMVDGGIQLSSAMLTRFCASIHSHCPTRGPPGPQGIPGVSVKGERGLLGLRGFPGPTGIRGIPGEKGSKGEIGAPGFGIPGRPGLKGERGLRGEKGEMGEFGLPGVKGQPGEAGLTGQGVKGEPGVDGKPGEPGLPGLNGRNGITGQKGEPGEKGYTGSTGLKGAKGEMGLAGRTGMVGPRGSIGFPGPAGEPGLKGSKGDKGEVGPTGDSGTKGQKGHTGGLGLPGPPGFPGSVGKPGKTGRNGDRGPAGDQGAPGLKGAKGDTGEMGLPGDSAELTVNDFHALNITDLLKGATGITGEKGEPGLQGGRGKKGRKGEKGEPGNALQCECLVGPPGPPGEPGVCKDSEEAEQTTEFAPNDQPATTPYFTLYEDTTISDRNQDFLISLIGKPLHNRQLQTQWGSWMIDSDPTRITKDKYFITQHFTGSIVYEFSGYSHLTNPDSDFSDQYNIPDIFYGTGGAVYKGAFYYHSAGFDTIARYDFQYKRITARRRVDQSLYRGSSSLYSTPYNYYDFSVDENGLWLIYAYKPSLVEPAWDNMLVVAKLDPSSLEIEKTWNITVDRKQFANGFITHGILYLLDSATDKNTHLSFAYDLYAGHVIPITPLDFTNIFRSNKMLSYDYLSRWILSWDNGRLISYPFNVLRRA